MFKKFRRILAGTTSTAVMAGMVTAGAVAGSVATAAPAAAVTNVTIGTVQAQMAGHTGQTQGNSDGNCIRFSPPDNSTSPPNKTTWVTYSTEAAAGHGRPCYDELNRDEQSAIGIQPVNSPSTFAVPIGEPFLLGRMVHYNNPINTDEPARNSHFVGNLNLRFQNNPNQVFSFPYDLYETPNGNGDAPGCPDNIDQDQSDCSDDILNFTEQTSETEVVIDNIAYGLVARGFVPNGTGINTCPAQPAGAVKNKFITKERKETTGCLYGILVQKRDLTITKQVTWGDTGPASIPAFNFTADSNLDGSVWNTDPGVLQPDKIKDATKSYGPKKLNAGGETVTVKETNANNGDWDLTSIQCVDGLGQVLTTGITTNAGQGSLQIQNVEPVTNKDAAPINCTFRNTYNSPGINVVKAADKTKVHSGDTVKYTYTVTNTGSKPLSNVSVTDDKCSPVSYKSGDTNSDGKLQTTETWLYECSTPLTNTTTNTATAAGTSPGGTRVTDDDQVTVTVLKPGIKVVKAADKTQVHSGDTVKYTYTVTNTGDTPLSNVSVTDDKCSPVSYKSGDTNSDSKLQTTETWLYECSTPLTNTTTNTAVAKGKDELNKEVTDDDQVTVTVLKPGIKVVKAADKTKVHSGDTVKYTYTVTNTGDTPLSNVSVTDDKCSPVSYKSGDTNSDSKLQTTETWLYECSTPLTNTTTNTAVAKGKDELNKEVTDDDQVTVTVLKPGIKVVKAADKTKVHSGDTVKYTYTVTNTGDTPLSNVSVTDDKCSPVSYKSGDTNSDSKLQTTETWLYECSTPLTNTTTNTAVAKGKDELNKEVTDDDQVTVTVLKPGIKVVKAADKTKVHSGDTVKYTYTVTNTGDTPLSNVSVTDDKCSPVSYKSGDTNSDSKLQTTETWLYECSTPLTNTTTNTAVAKGKDELNKEVTDDDQVTVTVLKPGIKVVKAADKTKVHSGDTVKYTYTVTNTGDTPLSNVSVTDDKCSPVSYKSGDTNSDSKLQTTETWLYECSTPLTNTTTNTAVAKGKDELNKEVTDDDQVTVTVLKPGIKVVKAADKTKVHSGDTVKYTYTVTNTGDTPLSNVSVTDDKCSPVSYKSGDTNSDSKLQTTETWLYECSTPLTNTTTNTAVAKGKDELNKEVTDDDQVTVTVLKAWLKLVKVVNGKGSAHDWTLTAEANQNPNAPKVKNLGDEGQRTEVWSQAEYTLTETGPGRYSPSDWLCVAVGDEEQTKLNEGDKITLATNQDVVCTITNSRNMAELKLMKQVDGGKAVADDFILSAKADAPDNDLNFSNKGGSGDFNQVFAETQYKLSETGPAGYTGSQWVCEGGQVRPQFVATGDTITLDKNDRVTCTIVNTRDLGSLTITKEFNPQTSGFTGTFDINYTCVDGADPVKSGTVKLGNGQSETISGLPTGTTCTVTEPTLPAAPTGWTFNAPTFTPANGQVTVTAKDQTVSVQVINSISQVSPVVVKKVCPIEPTLVKKVKKNGNRILIKKIKTNKSSCVLLKPVVLCKPLGSAAAGETAFCDTNVTKRGRVTVNTKGYDAVKVTVVVRSKPKPGFADRWKPNTWRKSWILR